MAVNGLRGSPNGPETRGYDHLSQTLAGSPNRGHSKGEWVPFREEKLPALIPKMEKIVQKEKSSGGEGTEDVVENYFVFRTDGIEDARKERKRKRGIEKKFFRKMDKLVKIKEGSLAEKNLEVEVSGLEKRTIAVSEWTGRRKKRGEGGGRQNCMQ